MYTTAEALSDVDPFGYGYGGYVTFLVRDDAGLDTLFYFEGSEGEGEGEGEFDLYRIEIEPDVVGYNSWAHWDSIAQSYDIDIAVATPLQLTDALISYWGPQELDTYPLHFSGLAAILTAYPFLSEWIDSDEEVV